MDMNRDELLAKFQAQYSTAWVEAVLDRFAYLASRTMPTDKQEVEYIMLHDWIRKMVVAGVDKS
jgi:hypothetical protein